ncbi:hypothetical protein JB92DRAFT_258817 [Gautieria morchelliformis]|nr:hypothetical protein JB92DRAFT_258817 [Gautieria morchelliformis]
MGSLAESSVSSVATTSLSPTIILLPILPSPAESSPSVVTTSLSATLTPLPPLPSSQLSTTSQPSTTSQLSTSLIGSHSGSLVPSVTTPLTTLAAVASTIASASQATHTPTSTIASALQATRTPTFTIASAPQTTHTPTSTIVSAPQASHGSSAILIGAVLGGIVFFLVCLIPVFLLRRRRNAALLSTQTETRTGSRRWDALHRIFYTRPPAVTTPFHLSGAETSAGRGATDLNHKQDMASHALPAFVIHSSAMPARYGLGQVSDDLSVHQSVMSEEQLPSYSSIQRPAGAPSDPVRISPGPGRWHQLVICKSKIRDGSVGIVPYRP